MQKSLHSGRFLKQVWVHRHGGRLRTTKQTEASCNGWRTRFWPHIHAGPAPGFGSTNSPPKDGSDRTIAPAAASRSINKEPAGSRQPRLRTTKQTEASCNVWRTRFWPHNVWRTRFWPHIHAGRAQGFGSTNSPPKDGSDRTIAPAAASRSINKEQAGSRQPSR